MSKELTQADLEAIERFKAFLRIRSITSEIPMGADKQVIEFVETQAKELGLEFNVYTYTEGYPVLVCTLKGQNPDQQSVLLNCHYDVVPVYPEKWDHDPFAAVELENGDIVARGTQDMKCVCIQYFEAIRRLLANGFKPERTIHIALQPDEECGGKLGMAKWIKSEEFKKLNVGFALDEGIANETNKMTLFYGERTVWWLKLIARGPTGHASRFIKDTAVEKLFNAVKKFLDYRRYQEALLEDSSLPRDHTFPAPAMEQAEAKGEHHDSHVGCKHAVAAQLGDVVTLNLTLLQAGLSNGNSYALNVIPIEAVAGFDIRIPPHVSLQEFEKQIREAIGDIEIEFVVKSEVNRVTSLDPEVNVHWCRFKRACDAAGVELESQIFPAATDGRYLRNEADLPVLGFSPIRKQPILLHEHNERLNKHTFIEGISVFEHVITEISKLE